VPEIRFRSYRLDPRHLTQLRFRQRLEAMNPDQVRLYIEKARDSTVVDYLGRLLLLTRENDALNRAPQGDRMSVTFIMGTDPNPLNRFYTAAADFYRQNDSARTECVELSQRSLVEVRDFLEQHRPANGLPWGTINIVVHTYEWGGLSIPVVPGPGRTDATSLLRAIASCDFRPLPDSIVDCRTDIRIQGCALGRDTAFLELLSTAFGDTGFQRPVVRSSRYFVYYASLRGPGRPAQAEQFFADYWYVTNPKGQRPSRSDLARRLRDRYPDANIDWTDALSRDAPRQIGDCYRHTYQLPLTWLVIYPDTAQRPRIDGARRERAWLQGQQDMMGYLDRLGLGPNDFLWLVRDTTVLECDTMRPAVLALGRGTVVSVLREITEPDPADPSQGRRAHASATDERFFTAIIPVRPPARPLGWNVAYP
jgi:hypothetical protein